MIGSEPVEANPSLAGPPCPYCQHASYFFLSSTDYNRYTTQEIFRYYKCTSCGLIFMSPIPGDMAPFYSGGYEEIPATLDALRAIAANERYRLDPVLRHKRAGKLLEIGPWRGVFCCNAMDAGFDVSAIEMNQECVDFLNDVVGIKASQSFDPAATLEASTERFDVIALWHSLEHLPRPWKVVENAAARLAPGGLLLLAIPNIDSYEFSVLQGKWRHIDAPRHLFFYPIQSLVDLAEAQGLKTLELETHDPLSRLLALDTWRKWSHLRFRREIREGVTRLMDLRARLAQRGMKHSGSGLIAVFQAPERAGEGDQAAATGV